MIIIMIKFVIGIKILIKKKWQKVVEDLNSKWTKLSLLGLSY